MLAYTDTHPPAESAPLPIQLQLADTQTGPDKDKNLTVYENINFKYL